MPFGCAWRRHSRPARTSSSGRSSTAGSPTTGSTSPSRATRSPSVSCTRRPRSGGSSRTRSSGWATRSATTARFETVEYNFGQARLRADSSEPITTRDVLPGRRHGPPHGNVSVADPLDGRRSRPDLHGPPSARCYRRDAIDATALSDLPPVRGTRGRSRTDARRLEGHAAARGARALRRGPARPLPYALLPVHGAVDGARRLVAASAAAKAAGPASTPVGSRWAAPAWSNPRRVQNVGLDPQEWSGFAFGVGLERVAQLRHGIAEIRPLWSPDLRGSETVLRVPSPGFATTSRSTCRLPSWRTGSASPPPRWRASCIAAFRTRMATSGSSASDVFSRRGKHPNADRLQAVPGRRRRGRGASDRLRRMELRSRSDRRGRSTRCCAARRPQARVDKAARRALERNDPRGGRDRARCRPTPGSCCCPTSGEAGHTARGQARPHRGHPGPWSRPGTVLICSPCTESPARWPRSTGSSSRRRREKTRSREGETSASTFESRT